MPFALKPEIRGASLHEVFLGETKCDVAELGTKLKAVYEEKPDERVFIRGDKSVNYGKMMEVMGAVIDSGSASSAFLVSRRSNSATASAR
jgi:biopolymer transport protein TolR